MSKTASDIDLSHNRYTPIPEVDFYQTVFCRIYNRDASYHDSIDPHNVAILYMILAIGTLVNLDYPAHPPEATQYYQLGRAALSLSSVFEEQSITAIQALVSMPYSSVRRV